MQKIVPFIWFDEQAEEAVKHYTSIFQNASIGEIARYGDDVPGPKGKVMTINFQLAGQDFMALNGGPEFQISPAVSFFVHCETPEELETLWTQLLAGGIAMMPLQEYPFSEKFGWVSDRFGVSWQLSLTRTPQRISNYLLFVGDQQGRAEEAVGFYTSVFPDSRIEEMLRHEKDSGEPEGSIMHARFLLAGQEFMAMDSAQPHGFVFTPAISFFVNCQDQAEVDHYWDRLSQGGVIEQCGWLRDRFGVSWQIVPTILYELMNDPDPNRARCVTQAMLKMVKLDIVELKAAFDEGK